ncbi:hypothetical protein HMPREF0185_03280 [Brevundimonas diminuta 470-4]|nr:hypothetical protein HMPREF0185_03280 [Brevundimonas diminuta 470-4]
MSRWNKIPYVIEIYSNIRNFASYLLDWFSRLARILRPALSMLFSGLSRCRAVIAFARRP